MKPAFVVALVAPALIVTLAAGTARAEDVDGRYTGTFSSTGSCSNGGPTQMVIKDRSFTRRFGPSTQFEATVAPDGSVSSQQGAASLTGTVKNGHAELDIGSAGGKCRSHQVLDKG